MLPPVGMEKKLAKNGPSPHGNVWQKHCLAGALKERTTERDRSSAFRFNIGGGTAEQGDSSGISDVARRVECFLSPSGKYDWNKQQGYTWLLKQAKNYGVKNLIAFVNSPPVQFTKNGLGYKLQKDFVSNLQEDKYDAYANFLSTVVEHYDKINCHFNYISPVNEPQWIGAVHTEMPNKKAVPGQTKRSTKW